MWVVKAHDAVIPRETYAEAKYTYAADQRSNVGHIRITVTESLTNRIIIKKEIAGYKILILTGVLGRVV